MCVDEQSSDLNKGLSFNERSALNVKVMKNRRDPCEKFFVKIKSILTVILTQILQRSVQRVMQSSQS